MPTLALSEERRLGKEAKSSLQNPDRKLEGVVVVVVLGRVEVARSPPQQSVSQSVSPAVVTMADGEINIDSLIQRLLEGEI